MLSSQLYQPKLKHLVGTGTADYPCLPNGCGVVASGERHGEEKGRAVGHAVQEQRRVVREYAAREPMLSDEV